MCAKCNNTLFVGPIQSRSMAASPGHLAACSTVQRDASVTLIRIQRNDSSQQNMVYNHSSFTGRIYTGLHGQRGPTARAHLAHGRTLFSIAGEAKTTELMVLNVTIYVVLRLYAP